MGRVGSGFGRFFRAIASVITLGLVRFSEPIERNPEVVGLDYDEVIREKARAAQLLKNAVGDLIAQQEMKKQKIEALTREIVELEQEKAGAQALARERVEVLRAQGLGDEAILKDGEVTQYQTAYTDVSSALEEKKSRVGDLEKDVEHLQGAIDQHVAQAQALAREVEKLRSEKHEAIASIAAAQQIDQINEALSGISTGGADDTLARLRRQRAEAEGRARAGTRVAGVDVNLQREKLRKAAVRYTQNADFLRGIGLEVGKTAETPAPEKEATNAPMDVRLPEEE
jgi:phage shock protein A